MNREKSIHLKTTSLKCIGSYTLSSFSFIIEFLRLLLVYNAHPSAKLSELGSLKEESVRITDLETRKRIKAFLADLQSDSKQGMDRYIYFLEYALRSDEADSQLQQVAASCLLEVISLSPSSLSSSYRSQISWLKEFLYSINFDTRMAVAHILGIVVTSGLSDSSDKNELSVLFFELKKVANDGSKLITIESKQGAMLAMGFIASRVILRYPTTFESILSTSDIESIMECIRSGLNSDSSIQIIGSCVALGELTRYAPLPFFQNISRDPNNVANSDVSKVISLAKSSRDVKVQEAAISCLGHLALGNPVFFETITPFLFTLPALFSKHIDIHFSVGEAIATAIFGFSATFMDEFLDIPDAHYPPNGSNLGFPHESVSKPILQKILEELRPGTVHFDSLLGSRSSSRILYLVTDISKILWQVSCFTRKCYENTSILFQLVG